MDEKQQQQAIDALRDWSKWLIGINFFAAAGCTAVLKSGVQNLLPQLFLRFGIAAFAISAICSSFLVRVLASVVERLPIQDESGNSVSIDKYKIYFSDLILGFDQFIRGKRISVADWSRLQLTITWAGVLFLILWVMTLDFSQA